MQTVSCFIWDVNPVLVTLGPISIRWYGLLFSMVFLIGYALLHWQFKRAGIADYPAGVTVLYRLAFYLIIGIVCGAYLGHRVFYKWEMFFANPLSTLGSPRGLRGLSSHGATIGILLVLFLFHLRHKIRYLELLDRFSFSTAVGATLVRLGNLMNSEIVGRKTDVAWAFCFPRFDGALIPRHPSQIYEAVIGLATLLILLVADRGAGRENRPLGLMAGVFLSVYFSLRFLVEFFKEYHTLPPDFPLTMGQLLSTPFALVGVGLLVWSLKKRLPAALLPSERWES